MPLFRTFSLSRNAFDFKLDTVMLRSLASSARLWPSAIARHAFGP
jgi:hypothetical protein